MDHHRALGAFGEGVAADWYESAGFCVIDRNWRGHRGELDLVVARFRRRRVALAVFVEVKTRTSDRFGPGVLAVDERKQARIRALAGEWLSLQRVGVDESRFDIVEVDARGRVQVYEAAF